MEFNAVLESRHSVRYFLDTPIDESVLTNLVLQAQLSPSWVNAQEHKVWIATGEVLEKIREQYHAKFEEGIKGYADLPVTSRETWSAQAQQNMKTFSQSRIDAGLQEIKELSESYLFHAPAVAYLTLPKNHNDWALLDLGTFEMTMMLAAANVGLGSVPAYNLVKYPDVLRDLLGIPENEKLIIGIALGYAADVPLNSFRSTRQPVENILTIKK